MRRPPGPMSTKPRVVVVQWRHFELVLAVRRGYLPIAIQAAGSRQRDGLVVHRGHMWGLSMPTMPGAVSANGVSPPRSTPKTLSQFPELSSWLKDTAYPDGKPVGMVQFSVRPKGAVYVVQLRIQDQGGLLMSVEDASLDDALVLLEAALTAVPPMWVRDPYPLGAVTSKRK